jgi:hypothetical protein
MQWFAFDSHKHCTWALVQDETGKVLREQRINHTRGALREFLDRGIRGHEPDYSRRWSGNRVCVPRIRPTFGNQSC